MVGSQQLDFLLLCVVTSVSIYKAVVFTVCVMLGMSGSLHSVV